ncbi:hypothetical protein [Cardiobacterium valvarum]|uniref:hypothetical protein n=1 Tax=Cardiobacterium valvarum TaxID=194702 RepID=UPI0035EFE923
MPDCLSLRELPRQDYSWLPPSCAYRLRHEGKTCPTGTISSAETKKKCTADTAACATLHSVKTKATP